MNSQTLNNLFNNDIIPYVPPELCTSPVLSSLNGAQNPYLDSAQRGYLYKNSGTQCDKFEGCCQNMDAQNYLNVNPMEYNAQRNLAGGFGGINGNVFFNNVNAGLNGFGLEGIGTNKNEGMHGFGLAGVGGEQNYNLGVNNTGSKLIATYSKIPDIFKGLLSAGIIVATARFCWKKLKH